MTRSAFPRPARPGAPAPIAIVGSFSLDSVVTPDGEALPAKPGGNALWSAMGAYVAGQVPGVVARVGTDYPAEVLDRLAGAGFDLGTLIRLDRRHPVRVSYAHRHDGSRIQPVPPEMIAHLSPGARAEFVDTTHSPETLVEGAPLPQDIPARWPETIGHWHLPLLPLARHRALVAALSQARGCLQTDCPTRQALFDDPFGKLRATLPGIDVFLPSTSDFDVIAPALDPMQVLRLLRENGARTLVLKAGAGGVFVLDGVRLLHMAAYPGRPVDPTGAGDAFCGGFLVARSRGADPLDAAALGSACASFALDTADPLDLLDIDPAEVDRRAAEVRDSARLVSTAFPLPQLQDDPAQFQEDPTA